MDLSKIEFGALAAERDGGLVSYFVESQSYIRLRDGVRRVVLGNRGSGKSAIFRMIAEREKAKASVVIQLAPEDYSYELLQQSLASESSGSWAKHGAYAAAWKFLIYVLVMKKLVSKAGFKSGASARIYNYLRDHHANFDKNPIGVLISYLKRLEAVKLGSFEAGLASRKLQKLYKLEEINSLLVDVDELAKKRRVVVLIDELDRGWDASEDAVAFVAGLFQAATSISSQTPNINVLISLRKELYDNIPALYEDAQKVRDLIEEIEWNEPQLLELIARRIAPGSKEIEPGAVWNTVFAENLDYRSTRSFNYVVDRTLYRPREIIQFCSDIKRAAVDTGEPAPLNYRIISEAENRYSEERLKDIAAEYRFQFPDLLSVFETFRGGATTYLRDALEFHCLRLTTGEIRVSKPAFEWVRSTQPEDLVEVLWRIGFVRAQAVGGVRARKRSGSRYLGSHQISNLNLRTITRFHVHAMFRAALGVKEKTET